MATGWLEQKQHWRQYKARVEALPANYRGAVEALQRYLEQFGPDHMPSLQLALDDLADLFEQGAVARTPIRAIVGENPAEFAEAFLSNYPAGQWIREERERLSNSINRAAVEPLRQGGR